MKKKIGIVVGLLVLVALAWYSIYLINGRGHSSEQFVREEFAIKDTASIDRITIIEPNGLQFEVVRSGKKWTTSKGDCVPAVLVDNILDAAFNAHFKGFIPENSKENVTNRMAATATTVKFYVNGEWHKTWYVGTATSDHMGTYMMMESAEYGKGEFPVIAELENMVGIIGPRFFADARKWACTGVFDYEISEIAKVEVKFPGKSTSNFSVTATGAKFKVETNGQQLTGLNDALITKYLANYKKINFENPNYELKNSQVDSLKATTPFCILKLKTKTGKTEQLKMFRKKADEGSNDNFGNFGEDLGDSDINRFWCQLPSGEIVKCQYFVFDPLIRGDIHFGFGKPTQ